MVIGHAYHKKVRFKTLGGLSDRTRTIERDSRVHLRLGVGQATAWLGLAWLKPQFSWLEFSLAWLKPKYFGLPSQQAKIKPIFKIVIKNFYTYSCVLKFYLSKIFGKCKNIKIVFENGLA